MHAIIRIVRYYIIALCGQYFITIFIAWKLGTLRCSRGWLMGWIDWKFKYVITVSITKQVIEMSRGPTSSSKWLHKVEKIGTWMKKKVKKVNKRWRRWLGSAHGWAPVPGQPHMARNVLIVIGLIVLGVLVFCLCCYKVNHNQAFYWTD